MRVATSEKTMTSPFASSIAVFCAFSLPSRSAARTSRTPRSAYSRTISSVRSSEQSEATINSKRAASNLTEIGKHTSELQSRENLVCRLLLEKKKKTNIVQASQ